jgi:transcriptional regulator with XRE-family HTH domain
MAQYVDLARLRQLLVQGCSQRAMARELGISRTALQRLLHSLKTPAAAPSAPALQQILQRLQRLETALHRGQTTGGDPPPGSQVTSDLSVRWSVRVPRSMAQHVRTLATVRKQPPSRLVQEALRHWLAGQ